MSIDLELQMIRIKIDALLKQEKAILDFKKKAAELSNGQLHIDDLKETTEK